MVVGRIMSRVTVSIEWPPWLGGQDTTSAEPEARLRLRVVRETAEPSSHHHGKAPATAAIHLATRAQKGTLATSAAGSKRTARVRGTLIRHALAGLQQRLQIAEDPWPATATLGRITAARH